MHPTLKKYYYLTITSLLFLPVVSYAWKPGSNEGIVPKCDGPCGFKELIQLIKNLLDVFIWISVPIATILFVWIGFDFVVNADKAAARSAAKKRLGLLIWGMVFILAGWLIVKTIVVGLGGTGDVKQFLDL